MKNRTKDNPVPSIDKNKIYEALKAEFWNGHFIEIHSGDLEVLVNVIYKTVSSLEEKAVQHGVETNNEKPKCEHPYKRTHRVGSIAFCNKCRTLIN